MKINTNTTNTSLLNTGVSYVRVRSKSKVSSTFSVFEPLGTLGAYLFNLE